MSFNPLRVSLSHAEQVQIVRPDYIMHGISFAMRITIAQGTFYNWL